MDESAVRLMETDPLRDPVLYAAWPGMGNIALNAARYLIETLEMEPLGTIEASEFVYAEGVYVRDKTILPLQTPEYQFHLHRHPDGKGDLVIFTADMQPSHPEGYLLARTLVEAVRALGVRRIYTGAALASAISHMEPPRVWGVATSKELWGQLERLGVNLLADGHISGLNGLLIGVAMQMHTEGICMLGELPYYLIGTDNPKSSLAVLERLCQLWQIHPDLSGLREAALRKEMEVEEFIRQGDKELVLEQVLRRGDSGTETPQ